MKSSLKNQFETKIRKLSDHFNTDDKLYVSVLEYNLSHGVLKLGIHKGIPFKRLEVVCGGCFYFCGEMEGGPYTLDISVNYDKKDNIEFIMITGNSSDLIVKCTRLNEPVRLG